MPKPPDPSVYGRRTAAALKAHAKALRNQGLIIAIIGIIAVLVPEVVTIAVELTVGWLFLVLGLVRILLIYRLPPYPGRLRSLATAVLAMALGLVLLTHPFAGALTLTMALVIFFALEGLIIIAVALGLRQHLAGWLGILGTGVVDLLLAVAILAGWPGTADWAIGLLVGLNLLSLGISMILLGRGAERLP